ncbi:uncharacterized protein BDZ99DRAFT_93470 [Mytilinidion resinicola]|uniref:F-box domain-containing protein n=1 Tax=Mytilinidion resinicola TaxID=574789 RepID=A0A6A6YBV2_9PEZI|nr:uncharacterized protein BDZ99DRAFT_93470 [Mytilinidion resinicola]KAF2806301.1 hypothetical protein BDZ99DRAFT_93470 [Mytilinidion resinicola]
MKPGNEDNSFAPATNDDRETRPDVDNSPDHDLTTTIEPTEATSSPSNPAAHAVFASYELLEEILTYLPAREVCRAQMVNRTWRDVVRSSPSLQRNAFLASAFPLVSRKPGHRYMEGRSLDEYGSFWAGLYGDRDGVTAFNPLVDEIFNSSPYGQPDFLIKSNAQTGDVLLDIAKNWFNEAYYPADLKDLIPFIECVLGINVEIPGWNKDVKEASWRQMLVVDPPGTCVAIAVGQEIEQGNYERLPVREWASPSLTLGELIDQLVIQLVEDNCIPKECGEGVLVSESTQHRKLYTYIYRVY